MTKSWIVAVVSLALLSACGSGKGGPAGPTPVCGDGVCNGNEPTACEADCGSGGVNVAACAGGASQAEIDATVQIALDFKQSCHEMVVCGGLQFAFVTALVDALVTLAQDASSSALPEGFSYEGAGKYHTEASISKMDLEVRLGKDYSFGAKGDVVVENLFVLDSYLVGASSTIDTGSQSLEISFDAPGPLVELLGQGPSPTSPITVSLTDLEQLEAQLRTLEVKASVELSGEEGASTVTYHVDYPPMPASQLLSSGSTDISLVDAAATRADRNQSLSIDTWQVAYVDGQVGALDGTIAFNVDGDAFPFQGRFDYPQANEPIVTIGCK